MMTRRLMTLFAFVCALWMTASPAMAGDLELPPVEKLQLKNGLQVRLIERHQLPLVSLHLLFKGGSAADPAGQEGLANLTSELLRAGAGTRDAQALAAAFDSLGASFDCSVGRDASSITLEVLSKDLPTAAGLLADVVYRPSFPAEELERTRRQLLARIQETWDNPSALASVAFNDQLYRGHPYGHPEVGYEASLSKLTREDVLRFHGGIYRPENAMLVVVGDFKSADAKKLLAKSLEGWQKALTGRTAIQVTLPPTPEPIQGQQVILVHRPNLTQAQIRIGNMGIAAGDPLEVPLAVTNVALGGGFTSRLNQEIRVNRSLSYGANSGWRTWIKPGPFLMTTFTKNETVGETVKVALETARGFTKDGLSAEELEKARATSLGRFAEGLQYPEALAMQLARLELFGLPMETLTQYVSRVKGLDQATAKKALERFPTTNLLIVVYADRTKVEDQLKAFGPVKVVEDPAFKAN